MLAPDEASRAIEEIDKVYDKKEEEKKQQEEEIEQAFVVYDSGQVYIPKQTQKEIEQAFVVYGYGQVYIPNKRRKKLYDRYPFYPGTMRFAIIRQPTEQTVKVSYKQLLEKCSNYSSPPWSVSSSGGIRAYLYGYYDEVLERLRENDSTLTSLDLGHTCIYIGPEGATKLLACLKINSTLTSLIFERNLIDDKGAKELSSCLKINSTLTSLNLGDPSSKKIGYKGAKELSSCLKINSTLTSLNLGSNDIGDEGAKELASCLKINSTLISLNIRCTNIGYEGARELSSCLKINSTLISLNIEGMYGSYQEEIHKSLRSNEEKRLTIRRMNLVRCLIVIGRYRSKNLSTYNTDDSIVTLPLDVLVYLTRFFHQSDFGVNQDKLAKWVRWIITNNHQQIDVIFQFIKTN